MVIQSFWSKPFLKNSNHPNARFKGGWLHEKYFYYSIALSCLKFKEFYSDVTLYTDSNGNKTLNKILQVPYDNYEVTLDCLNSYNEQLWALPKLHTYSIQEKPFIHADTDVFIWKKFSNDLVKSPIFCQNIEENYPVYGETLDEILRILDWIPAEIINSLYSHKKTMAFNAGVLGGTNLSFYKTLYKKALKMITENQHLFNKMDVGMFNMIFEQLLGHAIADKNNIRMNTLFDHVDANFSQLTKFHLAGFHTNYVHAIGYAKKSLHACEQIEALLMFEYPEHYKRIKHNGIHNSLWENEYEISNKRKKFLFKIFTWLRSSSLEAIYDTKFNLKASVKFIEGNDGMTIFFENPQYQKTERLLLEDWDNLLLYFQESLSINDLCNELITDEDIKNKYTENKLKEKILSFVLDKCILHEIFIPENIFLEEKQIISFT